MEVQHGSSTYHALIQKTINTKLKVVFKIIETIAASTSFIFIIIKFEKNSTSHSAGKIFLILEIDDIRQEI